MESLEKISCQFCGDHEMVIGHSQFEGCIYVENADGDSTPHIVQHYICSTCKAIVKSSVSKKLFCQCPLCHP